MFSAVWETMLGRHVKPGNGRRRKRAACPPLPHLLGGYGEPGDGEGRWDKQGRNGGNDKRRGGRGVWLR